MTSKLLMENLNNALDDVQMSSQHCDAINGCIDRIIELREEQKCAEQELNQCIDKLCADLATEVRALQPYLTVTLKTGCCEIGYRTRILNCTVKPYDKCWGFDATEFGQFFAKRYPECRPLDCPINELAKCLVEYFCSNYRTLS